MGGGGERRLCPILYSLGVGPGEDRGVCPTLLGGGDRCVLYSLKGGGGEVCTIHILYSIVGGEIQ